MTRSVGLWAVVAVVVIGSVAPASAQSATDEWNVLVASYLMGAAMSGKTTVRGLDVNVDMSASDVFKAMRQIEVNSWLVGAVGLFPCREPEADSRGRHSPIA